MLKLVGLLALMSVAYAAVARYPPEEKPAEFADQEGCYLSILNMVLPYDQLYYPQGKCVAYLCQKSNNETQEFTCGAVAVRDGCRLSDVDLTKNYPGCCPMQVCDTTTTPATTPTTTATTTVAPTTTTPTTATPTTATPTTPASTSPVPSNQESSAYAYAQSGGGQPPIVQTATSGPNAVASASAS